MPIQSRNSVRGSNVLGAMPLKGTNLSDDSQMLDTNSALWIENYLVHGQAKMQKRPGQIVNFDTGEADEMPVSEEFRYGYDIIAYGSKVRSYNNDTGVFANIKTDFTSDRFTGGRYGDYFFINTPLDGLWRLYFQVTWAESYNLSGNNTFDINMNLGTSISAGQVLTDSTTGRTANVVSASVTSLTSMRLVVDTLSGAFTLGWAVTGGTLVNASLTNVNPFTVGNKITGATSGATAILLEQTDGGATGIFIFGSVNGSFASGELLTDTGSGRVLSTSLMTIGITQVTGAPKANVFKIMGKRGLLIGLQTDESAYNYSENDTGDNPPWENWATGTGFNDPGMGSNRNGGECKDAALIGDIFFIGQENGWYSFQITETDIGGVSGKIDTEVSTRQNFGVFRCVMTNVGMVVTNTSGLWMLVSLGQSNIAYSDQWEQLTEALGEDFFMDINLDTTDTMYDPQRGFLYCTMGKNSQTNNLILAVKATLGGVESPVKTGATSFLTGWNVLRFMTRGNMIYGTSAVDGIRHQLFVGQKDVDAAIHSEYVQELNFSFTEAFNLEEFLLKTEMSAASLLTVSFDTFDETGYYQTRRRAYYFRPRHAYVSDEGGWGSAAWGGAAWGGAAISGSLVPTKRGRLVKLRMLSRAWLRVESDDFAEHWLNFFSANATIVTRIRDNSLEEITS